MTEYVLHFDAILANAGEHSTAVLLLILFFGTLVSEDLACIAAGTLAANGRIGFAESVLACFFGIFAGDLLIYWVGRVFGGRVIESRIFRRFVSEAAVRKGANWLNERGAAAVFLSRFVVGLRLPTYVAAGILRTNFPKFTIYFAVAAAVWTPILVGSTAIWQKAVSGNIAAGAIAVFFAVRLAVKFSNWKNRRLLVGRIKRMVNWEFWPIQVFYFPVVCYVVLLAVKNRGLTVFTAANPGIPGGGFVGESKDQIYKLLQGSPSAERFMLQHRLIKASLDFTAKVDATNEFIAEKQLSFPIAVKPDKGERGEGVMIVGSQSELEDALSQANDDVIIQEFFDGDEASIFYYRLPGEKTGMIFSITEKRFPEVAGDGKSDLETLILRDRRGVCMAKSYIQHNNHRLIYVPASGEQVKLIDIGTHSRGAIFLDGARMKTAELEKRIDLICREIDGFFFGRFDIRVRSFADLQRGENFRIIELNGVTSESTNIYDPSYSLVDAYRILFAQWRLAFVIGRENIKMGAKPSSVAFLLNSWLASRFGPFAYSALSLSALCVRNPFNAKIAKSLMKQKRCA